MGMIWTLSVLVAAVAGRLWLPLSEGVTTRAGAPTAALLASPATVRLSHENDDLKQRVADLQRAAQVGDIAQRSLRTTLTSREAELSRLRADVGFYSRMVGGASASQAQGVAVQEVRLRATTTPRAWDLTVSLTQANRAAAEQTGHVRVSVEGLQGNAIKQLPWVAVGDAAQKSGLAFQLKYFQQLHGTLMLPAGFRPVRLHVSVQPERGAAASRSIAWTDAVGDTTSIAQENNDAR